LHRWVWLWGLRWWRRNRKAEGANIRVENFALNYVLVDMQLPVDFSVRLVNEVHTVDPFLQQFGVAPHELDCFGIKSFLMGALKPGIDFNENVFEAIKVAIKDCLNEVTDPRCDLLMVQLA